MMVNVPVCERCWFDREDFGHPANDRRRVPTRRLGGFEPPRACEVCKGLTVAGILVRVNRDRVTAWEAERLADDQLRVSLTQEEAIAWICEPIPGWTQEEEAQAILAFVDAGNGRFEWDELAEWKRMSWRREIRDER